MTLDLRPLHEIAAKLTHPKQPAYMHCPSLVFPAWVRSHKSFSWRGVRWNPAFPTCGDIREYAAKFELLNHLVPATEFRD